MTVKMFAFPAVLKIQQNRQKSQIKYQRKYSVQRDEETEIDERNEFWQYQNEKTGADEKGGADDCRSLDYNRSLQWIKRIISITAMNKVNRVIDAESQRDGGDYYGDHIKRHSKPAH